MRVEQTCLASLKLLESSLLKLVDVVQCCRLHIEGALFEDFVRCDVVEDIWLHHERLMEALQAWLLFEKFAFSYPLNALTQLKEHEIGVAGLGSKQELRR